MAEDGQPITGPTIQVGTTELTERLGLAPRYLAPDNWVVSRAGQALVVSGGDSEFDPDPASNILLPFGTLYAVYEFLERVVGVRWYWPGELGRVVPEHATLAVDGVRWGGAPTFDTRFAFNSYHDEADFTHLDIWTWWRRMRWGAPGGSPIGMHSFNDWPSRFGKQHPEWFALQDAGHTLIQEGSMGGHLDVALRESPSARDRLARRGVRVVRRAALEADRFATVRCLSGPVAANWMRRTTDSSPNSLPR